MSREFGCVKAKARLETEGGVEVIIETHGGTYEKSDTYSERWGRRSDYSDDVTYVGTAVAEETARRDQRRAVEWAKRHWPKAMGSTGARKARGPFRY